MELKVKNDFNSMYNLICTKLQSRELQKSGINVLIEEINMEALPSGLYLLNLQIDNEQFSYKIVKE
jgi:hydroxypyruvate isomerase